MVRDPARVVVADGVVFGEGLVLIAGPCVIESRDGTLRIAAALAQLCDRLSVPLVFKASFDKANRTSLSSYRGPGLQAGLEVLAAVHEQTGLPITTDIHLPAHARAVADVVQLVQVPAFLSRQTDLVVAAAATGLPVNLKKGQFMAPGDMAHAVDKACASGSGGVLVTERGTSFGYHDLVVDMRSFAQLADLGVPVVYDITHSVQTPGGRGATSGGNRQFAAPLARAAVAAGAQAVFAEVHEDPPEALSDAALQLPIGQVETLLRQLLAIRKAVGPS